MYKSNINQKFMRPLKIAVEDKEDYAIVKLSGTSRAVNKQSEEVTLIRETFRDLSKQGKSKILVDLQDVDYLSSNTIGAILSGNSIIKKIGGKIVIYNANDYIMNIFNIVQLHKVIPICKSFDEALEEVNRT